MSDTLPTPPNTSESIAYQPISGWAVAGLACSGLFALLVVASTLVGLFQGAPVFFPTWMVCLAVVGVVLSIIGQSHVQNSEGTRTGAKLARIGIWLGVVSGLSYYSYYFVTGMAIQDQANEFLMTKGTDAGFFPLLLEADKKPNALNAAYLLTRTARSGNPEDPKAMQMIHDLPSKEMAKGELGNFKDSIMPRVLYKKLGAEAEITPLSVQNWDYEKKSYQVKRLYSIKTKEIELEMLITVASLEAESAGQGRRWFINMRESGPVKKTLTKPLGEGVAAMRGNAAAWLQKTFTEFNEGKPFAEIKQMDQTQWHELALDRDPAKMRAILYDVLTSDKRGRAFLRVVTQPDHFGAWEMVDGKVRMLIHFHWDLTRGETPARSHLIDGYAIVQTRKDTDPARFTTGAETEWTLTGIVFTNIAAEPEAKGGPASP